MGRPKHIPRSPQFFEQLSFHSAPSPATAGRSHRTTDQIVSSLSLGQKGPDALQRAQSLSGIGITSGNGQSLCLMLIRAVCHSMSLLLSQQSLPVWKPRLLTRYCLCSSELKRPSLALSLLLSPAFTRNTTNSCKISTAVMGSRYQQPSVVLTYIHFVVFLLGLTELDFAGRQPLLARSAAAFDAIQ